MAINLSKGQKINLQKDTGEKLTNFCVGVNWGAIETVKKGLFKRQVIVEDVDLDLSCVMFDATGGMMDHIYSPDYNRYLSSKKQPLGKLDSVDGSMHHSGDDRQGDVGGDDGLDNEIITVDLSKTDPRIEQIFFFVNIYLKQGQSFDFAKIPFAKIRMYEGTPTKVNKVFSNFDIVTDNTFAGKLAIVLGKLHKTNGEWKFDAIGDATDDQMLLNTIQRIKDSYAR